MPKRAGLRDIPSLDITLATPLEGVKRLKGTGTFDTKRQRSFLRVPQLRRPPVRFPKLPCKMRNGSCEHCEVPARRPCSRGNDCGDVAHGVLGEPEGGRVLRCVRGGRRAAPRGALLAGAHHPGHDDRRRRLRVCW